MNKERATGFLVLFALAALVLATNHESTPKKITLFATFSAPTATPWLEVGSQVHVAGVPVGEITSLEPQLDGRVRAALEIDARLNLPRGTFATYVGPCRGPAVALNYPRSR